MIQLGKNFVNHIRELQKNRVNVVFIGLDGAGKTTICNTLAGQPDRSVVPTVGFNKPKEIKIERFDVKLFDIGGSRAFRKQWTSRLTRAHAAIFVVDSSSKERLLEARDELAAYSSQESFRGKPVLVFANKQDLPNALTDVELAAALGLDCGALAYCSHNIVKCVGKKSCNADVVDPAVETGFHWLVMTISKIWPELKARVRKDTVELERLEAIKREETARAVAERKRQRQLKSSSVVPATKDSTPEEVPTCEYMHVVDNKRVQCTNPATTRNLSTDWMRLCDTCCQEKLRVEQAPVPGELEPQRNTGQPSVSRKEFEASEPTGKTSGAREQAGGNKGQLQGGNAPTKPHGDAAYTPLKPAATFDPAKKAQQKHQLPPVTFPRNGPPTSSGRQVLPGPPNDTYGEVPAVGDAVFASFHAKGKWFPGTVIECDSAGDAVRFAVKYDDGDLEREVLWENICAASAAPLPQGTAVQCKFRGKGDVYSGKVLQCHDDGTYHVRYEDGDEDPKALRWWMKAEK